MQLLILDPDTVSGKIMHEVLQWLTPNGETEVTAAKARNQLHKRKAFQKGDTVNRAFLELAETGYVRMMTIEIKGPQRCSTVPALELNPHLLADKNPG